jgi:hypothetical protein
MPKIADVSGASVFIFVNDHAPPNVHVRYQDRAVRLRIEDGALMDRRYGLPDRILRSARAWLSENQSKAAETWARYHS